MSILRASLVLLLLASAPALGQDPLPPDFVPKNGPWLDDTAREKMALDLAIKFCEIDFGEERTRKECFEDAQERVDRLQARIELWGADGLVERGPTFPDLDLPAHPDRRLDAMARWGACSLYSETMWENPQQDAQNPMIRYGAAITSISIAAISLYLSVEVVRDGGSQEELAEYLGGAAMNGASIAISTDPQKLSYVFQRCSEPVNALISG